MREILTIVQDSHAINELFRGLIPKGVTPIGNKLEELLLEYLSIIEPLHNKPAELKKIKPINFLIITDGYPSMPNHLVLLFRFSNQYSR
jgi:hypothetical protein